MINVLRGVFTVVAAISIVGVLCVTMRVAWVRFVDDRELLVMVVLSVVGSVATVLEIFV